MKKKMIAIAVTCLIFMVICLCIDQRFHNPVALSAAITFGTCAYHFLMRLCVGACFDALMHNHADYTKPWYQTNTWEQRIYQKLHLKMWKHKLPTFYEDTLDVTQHTWMRLRR